MQGMKSCPTERLPSLVLLSRWKIGMRRAPACGLRADFRRNTHRVYQPPNERNYPWVEIDHALNFSGMIRVMTERRIRIGMYKNIKNKQ